MKYPQLVSTRAVNAISDWLVSRLEQLGVEAPQIYTRLLLSLLQSAVQINDPIEFSNLESFSATRRGHHRRYLHPSDTDTLKKLNAVQCLREIVSSEHELVTIELLVDELCDKLKDIEEQLAALDDTNKLLVVTLSLTAAANNSNDLCSSAKQHHHNNNNNNNCSSSSSGNISRFTQRPHHVSLSRERTTIEERANHNAPADQSSDKQPQQRQQHQQGAIGGRDAAIDIETDPSKRYFRAFPALNKDMEDSFRIWRRNAKSLTWPVAVTASAAADGNNVSLSSVSSSSSCSASDSNGSTTSSGGRGGGDALATHGGGAAAAAGTDKAIRTDSTDFHSKEGAGGVVATGGGVKRKTKRRRNQALSKGKSIQNLRKNSCGNANGVGSSGYGASGYGGRSQRYATPAFWDTDFQGCWEMGPDLIQEFIDKQNRNSAKHNNNNSSTHRNRSISESGAYKRISGGGVGGGGVDNQRPLLPTAEDALLSPMVEGKPSSGMSSPLIPIIDLAFCCDDEATDYVGDGGNTDANGDDYDGYDFDDTLASVSELTTDASLGAAAARRLYERETLSGCTPADQSAALTDVERFTAKFDSSIEALWKNAGDNSTPVVADGRMALKLTDMATATTTLPAVAPFRENLKHFWTNYYNHHYDLAKIPVTAAAPVTTVMLTAIDDSGSASLSCSGSGSGCSGSALNMTDMANTSDYYSMPSHLDDFDKSAGVVRRDFGAGRAIGLGGEPIGVENNGTPFGHFLRNSIWTENVASGAGDSDESFYFKVWNTKSNANRFDDAHGGKITTAANDGALIQFPPYSSSKWSEGINAGPIAVQQTQLHQLHAGNNSSNNASGIDCMDSASTATASLSVSTTSCSSSYAAAQAYNWQTPLMGSRGALQACSSSWAAKAVASSDAHPMSLTDMYGESSSGSCGGVGVGGSAAAVCGGVGEAPSAVVSLPNHSPRASGFVEYAQMKALVTIVRREEPPVSGSAHVPPLSILQSQEYHRYVEAPEENLLTSERTHFHPIKTYADGHAFDICGELDAVDFERSASGYLYLEADRYLEYTRTDTFIADDEHTASATAGASLSVLTPVVCGGGPGASAAPLYASSNCDAATQRRRNNNGCSNNKSEFIIRFRMRNCEIACQTDDNVVASPYAPQTPQVQHPLCLIFGSAGNGLRLQSTGLACNDAIEALNKAVEAAARAAAAAELPTDHHWLPAAASGYRQLTESASIWNIGRAPIDEVPCCDEVDYCNSGAAADALQRQWSMHQVGQNCQLNSYCSQDRANGGGCGDGGINGACDGGGVGGGLVDVHTLWGVCTSCDSSEWRSVPANRMLRDELLLEADEIMSDLRYMQDLYIGCADDVDEDVVGDADVDIYDDDEAEINCQAISGCGWDSERGPAALAYPPLNAAHFDIRMAAAGDVDNGRADAYCELTESQAQAAVLQQVNRLIANLLRPEAPPADPCPPVAVSDADAFNGDAVSLWYGRAGRNIWQPQQPSDANTLQPLELLRQLNVEPPLQANDFRTDSSQYLAQLSWEHDNLAQIWQQATPTPSSPQATSYTWALPLRSPTPLTLALATREAAAATSAALVQASSIAEKNLKNLQHSSTINCGSGGVGVGCGDVERQEAVAEAFGKEEPPITQTSAAVYRRVQQFLNSTSGAATKLTNRKRRHSASLNLFHYAPSGNFSNNIVNKNNNNNNNKDIADLNAKLLEQRENGSRMFANVVGGGGGGGGTDATDMRKLIQTTLLRQCAAQPNGRDAGGVEGVDRRYAVEDEGEEEDDDGMRSVAKQTIITCKYWTTRIAHAASPDQGIVSVAGLTSGGIIDDGGGDDDSNGAGDSDDVNGAFSCLINDKNASILRHVTMITRPLTR